MSIKTVPEIVQALNYIYNREKYPTQKPGVAQKKPKGVGKIKGKTLCEELELMLRFRESLLDKTSIDTTSDRYSKYFYNAEEYYFE